MLCLHFNLMLQLLITLILRILQASKAAMSAFYETLRVELGSDVKITIVTPGVIESEFTKGKVWTEEGMKVDQELRDVSYLLDFLSK